MTACGFVRAAIMAGSSGFFLVLFWFWYPSLLDLHSLPVQQAEPSTIGRPCEACGAEADDFHFSTAYLQPELQSSLPPKLRSGSSEWGELDRALQMASQGVEIGRSKSRAFLRSGTTSSKIEAGHSESIKAILLQVYQPVLKSLRLRPVNSAAAHTASSRSQRLE